MKLSFVFLIILCPSQRRGFSVFVFSQVCLSEYQLWSPVGALWKESDYTQHRSTSGSPSKTEGTQAQKRQFRKSVVTKRLLGNRQFVLKP